MSKFAFFFFFILCLFSLLFLVIWMKGLTDITDGPRSYKESIDDYVRLTLKRAVPSDEGTYCILVKNRYGCDRSFFSIKVRIFDKSGTKKI